MMNLTKKQEMECRALWRDCFHDSERYMDYYFGEKCKDSRVLLDIEDNHVVSMVYLNPYKLMWQGQAIKSYYIVGVATEEAYRKQGRMRKLLEQAFEQMQAEGIPFTYLMPASRKIYEPFGFGIVYRQKRIKVKGIEDKFIRQVKAAEAGRMDQKLSMKFFCELTEAELEKMVSYCQRKLSDEFDLYAVRDVEYYRQLQSEMQAMEGNIAVFETEAGEMAGVVAYGLENGYLDLVEGLIEKEFTERILGELIAIKEVTDTSQIYFYETWFWDEDVLVELGTELEYEDKETTMVKVFTGEKEYQTLYDNSKVYLNELV